MKTLIPGLVTLDTDLDYLRNCDFADDLNFFSDSEQPSEFNYRVTLTQSSLKTNEFAYRNASYYKIQQAWYYIPPWKFPRFFFRYHPASRSFAFNHLYSLLPFGIGGVETPGKHLSDFINLDLFLHDYLVFKGCSFIYKDKFYGLIIPSNNGKTILVNNLMRNGAEYFSDDLLLFEKSTLRAYQTIYRENLTRKGIYDHNLAKKIQKREPRLLDYLYLVHNNTHVPSENNRRFIDFLIGSSMFFLGNRFIRSYLSGEGKTEEFLGKVDQLRHFCSEKIKFKLIRDFDYSSFFD